MNIKCKIGIHKLDPAKVLGYHVGQKDKVRVCKSCSRCGKTFEYDTHLEKNYVRKIT